MTARPHEKNDQAAVGAEKRELLDLLEDLHAIGTPPGEVQERDPFEFPERRGL